MGNTPPWSTETLSSWEALEDVDYFNFIEAVLILDPTPHC